MKERPILFSTPMVRAILEGRKSQTRRIVKPSNGLQRTWLTQDLINEVPHGELINGGWQMHHPYAGQRINNIDISYDSPLGWVKCPYGKPGDILWVRETWCDPSGTSFPIIYRADMPQHWDSCETEADLGDVDLSANDFKWKPSIFMPKEASRLKLKVTNIRVERVQDITEEDALRECVEYMDNQMVEGEDDPCRIYCDYTDNETILMSAKSSYKSLWKSINGKDSWESNPWVWVIEFKKA